MRTITSARVLAAAVLAAGLTIAGAGTAGASEPANDNHPICERRQCHGDEPGEPGYEPPYEEECDDEGNCICLYDDEGFMDPGPGVPQRPGVNW